MRGEKCVNELASGNQMKEEETAKFPQICRYIYEIGKMLPEMHYLPRDSKEIVSL